MKRVIMLAAAVLMVTSLANAQLGHLGIFGDADATDCYPMDDYVGVLRFYVVLIESPGATAVEFSVAPGGGFVGSFLGDQVGSEGFVAVGNTDTGKTVAFGGCHAPKVHVLTISYFCQGLSETCAWMEVLPHPATGELQAVPCDYSGTESISGGKTYINHDGTCECEAPGFETSPATPSTWGKVKAIYAVQ